MSRRKIAKTLLAQTCDRLRSRRKRDIQRPYSPDYVSAETLAYRLDCSRSKIDADVRAGLLPKPIGVGTMQRWRWADVEEAIEAQNALASGNGAGAASLDDDPFIVGARRVAETES